MLRGRGRWLAQTLVCATLFCSTLVSPIYAKKTPAILTSTFRDRANPGGFNDKKIPQCQVNFVEIADNRTSPQLVGVVDRRAVHAPADKGAWLRAVLNGLRARGVRPLYDGYVSSDPDVPSVKFGLATAWISQSAGGYNGNVVISLTSTASDAAAFSKVYRARATRTDYWSSGDERMQSTIDGAFEDALEQMAVDLKTMCKAPVN